MRGINMQDDFYNHDILRTTKRDKDNIDETIKKPIIEPLEITKKEINDGNTEGWSGYGRTIASLVIAGILIILILGAVGWGLATGNSLFG